MHRVLIISYSYPPKLAISSLRAAKFAKYLPDFEWEPIILTIQPKNIDIGLDLPSEMKLGEVIRTRDFDFTNKIKKIFNIPTNKSIFNMEAKLSRSFNTKSQIIKIHLAKFLLAIVYQFVCFPDSKIGWYFIIKRQYIDIIKNYNIDMIFTSSGPNTVHFIGRHFKKVLGVPWVADFRDLWTQNHISRRIYPLWKIEQKLEKNTLRSCNAMTTVSKPLANALANFHGKPVTVIKNGFDESDYFPRSKKKKKNKLRIIYTGKIYPQKRDPSLIFKAIKKLIEENFLQPDELIIDFYGREMSWAKQISKKMNMTNLVRFHAMVPYHESVEIQMDADILLFLEWVAEKKGVYTGKIFEYLGAKRPILAFGPKGGIVEKLLEETNAGKLVADVYDAKAILRKWISIFKQKDEIPYNGNVKLINTKYTRRAQTKALAILFDSILEKQGGK